MEYWVFRMISNRSKMSLMDPLIIKNQFCIIQNLHKCHSFREQFQKTRYCSPNLSKLARADISCQFKKTRFLCRHCLQKEWTLASIPYSTSKKLVQNYKVPYSDYDVETLNALYRCLCSEAKQAIQWFLKLPICQIVVKTILHWFELYPKMVSQAKLYIQFFSAQGYPKNPINPVCY